MNIRNSSYTCMLVVFLGNGVSFRWFSIDVKDFYNFSSFAGLRNVKACREGLFWFEIWWRERRKVLVKFEKFYVVSANRKAPLSTVFPSKILRETTGASARNNTVSETDEFYR